MNASGERSLRGLLCRCVIAAAVLAATLPAAVASAQSSNTRPVLIVGNNWDGTADVIDPDPVSYTHLTLPTTPYV